MDIVVCAAIKNIAAILEMLSDYKTDLLARGYLKIKLFSTAVPIGPSTLLTGLTECNFSGYAPFTVSTINGPAVDSVLNGYLAVQGAYFQNNGGGVGNQVYSAALVSQVPGTTAATGTVTTTGGVISAPVITAPGSGYTSAPNVTVLGGGTGAVITATVVGGVVTALTLVSGGTGYTAATIVIDPPLEIIAGALLPNPMPMNNSSQALPLGLQITLQSGM
jgi:hypothetical protein